MKRSHLNRWLADLRSGKYEQAEGFLMNVGCTAGCCLGVYLDGRGLKQIQTTIQIEEDPTDVLEFQYDTGLPCEGGTSSVYNLPYSLYKEDGFNNENGRFWDHMAGVSVRIPIPGFPKPFECLTEMNDKGVPFDVIADVIQNNTKLIFSTPIEDDTIEV